MKLSYWLSVPFVCLSACSAQDVSSSFAPTQLTEPNGVETQSAPLSNDVRIVDVSVQMADDFQRSVVDNGIPDERVLREMSSGIEYGLLNSNVNGSSAARAVVKIKAFQFHQSTVTTETTVFDSQSGRRIGGPVTTTTKRPVGPTVYNTFNNHLPFRTVVLVGDYAGGKIASDLYGR